MNTHITIKKTGDDSLEASELTYFHDLEKSTVIRIAPRSSTKNLESNIHNNWQISVNSLSTLRLDIKANKYDDTSSNLYVALSHLEKIYYDEFSDAILANIEGLRPIHDSDYVKITMALTNAGFKEPPKDRLRNVIRAIANDNKIDTAKEWALNRKWDGIARCENLFSTYFGCPDSEFCRAVGNYFTTAMAGRILNAGTKADSIPIIIGKQGSYKSTAMAALSPFPSSFGEIDLSQRDDNLARQIKGKLIIAIDELRGFGAKEVTAIKHFITRQEDEWRPLWSEFTVKNQRRCVFIASTNDMEFLTDMTGNRRYLPLTQVANCDPRLLEKDREQIWAEAIQTFRTSGVLWEEAQRLCGATHLAHLITDDILIGQIEKVLDSCLSPSATREFEIFLMCDLTERLYGSGQFLDRKRQMALASAVGTLGFEKRPLRINGKLTKVWARVSATL